jgi:protein pelota
MGTTMLPVHEQLAIDLLLVTDELFWNTQVKTRKKYVQLVESGKENGELVLFCTHMHVGQQPQQVSCGGYSTVSSTRFR